MSERPDLRLVHDAAPDSPDEAAKLERVLGVVRGVGIDWHFLETTPKIVGNPFYDDDLPPAA